MCSISFRGLRICLYYIDDVRYCVEHILLTAKVLQMSRQDLLEQLAISEKSVQSAKEHLKATYLEDYEG